MHFCSVSMGSVKKLPGSTAKACSLKAERKGTSMRPWHSLWSHTPRDSPVLTRPQFYQTVWWYGQLSLLSFCCLVQITRWDSSRMRKRDIYWKVRLKIQFHKEKRKCSRSALKRIDMLCMHDSHCKNNMAEPVNSVAAIFWCRILAVGSYSEHVCLPGIYSPPWLRGHP